MFAFGIVVCYRIKEEKERRKDKQKLKEKDLPSLIKEQQIEPVKKRSKLVLPAPQVKFFYC